MWPLQGGWGSWPVCGEGPAPGRRSPWNPLPHLGALPTFLQPLWEQPSPGKRRVSLPSAPPPLPAACVVISLPPAPCSGDAGRQGPQQLGLHSSSVMATVQLPGLLPAQPPPCPFLLGEYCPFSVPWRGTGGDSKAQSPPPSARQESNIHVSKNLAAPELTLS